MTNLRLRTMTHRPPRLLVPYDFSVDARAALDLAVELAKRLAAELHLVHVLTPTARGRREIEDALAGVAENVRGSASSVDASVVKSRSVAEGLLLRASELRAEVILMGTHGWTAPAHAVLGSVAERVLQDAECAVLTIRADREEEPASRRRRERPPAPRSRPHSRRH
jgi:nucleotide-binding universal stress UspA family protein